MKIDYYFCSECDKTTLFRNNKCAECEGKEFSKKKRLHFASLKGLTLEERVDRLEHWQWEMQQNPPWVEPTF